MYRLLGALQTGSAIVETALCLSGLPYRTEDFDYDNESDRERLRQTNPLAQFPALVLPDGFVMTETAAMILHIGDLAPQAGLVPEADAPERARFLRWLIFFVANIYPTFTYGDVPERWVGNPDGAADLKSHTDAYCQKLWRIVEAELAPDPWFLGARFSALDLYVTTMIRWRPGRAWFAEHCPKLKGIADRALALPAAEPVWRRHR